VTKSTTYVTVKYPARSSLDSSKHKQTLRQSSFTKEVNISTEQYIKITITF